MKSARNRMDMTIAYREVGSYRGAAAMCGCDLKSIKRALARLAAGDTPAVRMEQARNYDVVRDVVAARVDKTARRNSAKRLLPEARTAGCPRRPANFGVWWPRRSATGVAPITAAAVRRCGHRATRCDRLGRRGSAGRVLRGTGLESVAVRALRRR